MKKTGRIILDGGFPPKEPLTERFAGLNERASRLVEALAQDQDLPVEVKYATAWAFFKNEAPAALGISGDERTLSARYAALSRSALMKGVKEELTGIKAILTDEESWVEQLGIIGDLRKSIEAIGQLRSIMDPAGKKDKP